MTRDEYYANLSNASFSLSHHGVEGQHWGKKNGPPYPLDATGKKNIKTQKRINKLEKKAQKAKGAKLGDLRTEINYEKNKLNYSNVRENYKNGKASSKEIREAGNNFEKAARDQSDNLFRKSRAQQYQSESHKFKAKVGAVVGTVSTMAGVAAAVSASPIMTTAVRLAVTSAAMTTGESIASRYYKMRSNKNYRKSERMYYKYKNPNGDLDIDLDDDSLED